MSRFALVVSLVLLLGDAAFADPHAEMAAALAAHADLHPAPPHLPVVASQIARRAADAPATGAKGPPDAAGHGNSEAAHAAHQAQGQGSSQAEASAHGAQSASESAAGQARAAAAKANHGHSPH